MAVSLSTRLGDIKIELQCEEEPDACMNFLALCASGFYDGMIFHRVVPGFLIQCGDNTKRGNGGTSPFGDGVDITPNEMFDEPWILAYADQDKGRSQFFITVKPHPQLNHQFCGFGKVIYGMNVVQSISRTPTLSDNYPVYPTVLLKTHIHYNPFAE